MRILMPSTLKPLGLASTSLANPFTKPDLHKMSNTGSGLQLLITHGIMSDEKLGSVATVVTDRPHDKSTPSGKPLFIAFFLLLLDHLCMLLYFQFLIYHYAVLFISELMVSLTSPLCNPIAELFCYGWFK